MEGIRRLPRGVHSSLRSGVTLCDLPRVVEELVYNSVEAGATKVFVYVGIQACYVKVEDDGCGITRDGLVILGERYATSKLHLLADMETSTDSLGFRGEALSSLSDVSLVEIRTKARGKPNAYCKILKGTKCLFLGIDDQREGVGTTVTVRDLFYNQPVRRKFMHSSPKRVLHSVKKCVFRTALVHPQVSFKVIDIESEDDLLCTIPSSSSLPLVSDGFGNEISSSLHEIVFSDQILMLSGYISGPDDAFSMKAFQYLYINSRFVSKGPIHNLLNSLAASFQCAFSQRQLEPGFHSGKRQKTEGYPAYMLNLCCPLSSYNLDFEPSKTIVEFKDWDTVLSFFEQAVRYFWKQLRAQSLQEKTSAHEICVPMKCEVQKEEMIATGTPRITKMRKTKCNIQFHQYSPSHSSTTNPQDISSEDSNAYEKCGRPPKERCRLSSGLRPCQNETKYFDQTDYSFRNLIQDSPDVFGRIPDQTASANRDCQFINYVDSLQLENHLFSNQTINVKEKYDMSGIIWKTSPEVDRNLKEESTQNIMTSDPYGLTNNAQDVHYPFDYPSGLNKPGIKRCSLMENKLDISEHYSNHSGFGFEFDHLGKDLSFHDTVNGTEDNYCSDGLNLKDNPFQKRRDPSSPSLGFLSKCQTTRELDVLSIDPFTCDRASLTEDNNLHNGLGAQVWENGSKFESPETGWFFASPHSSSNIAHDFTHSYTSKDILRSFKLDDCEQSDTVEDEVETLDSSLKSFNEDLPTMSWTRTRYSPKIKMHFYCASDDVNFEEISSLGKLDDGKVSGWLVSDTSNIKNTKSYTRSAFHISVQNYDKVMESPFFEHKFQNCRPSHIWKVRSRRSSSAPPFYKGKCKFSTLNDHLSRIAGNDPISHPSFSVKTTPETMSLSSDLSRPCCVSQPNLEPIIGEESQPCLRKCIDDNPSTNETKRTQNGELDKVHNNQLTHATAVEDSVTDELEYATATLTKWRNDFPLSTDGDILKKYPEQNDDILDISSGLLHLSGGSLVPESINKDCLEGAKVLLQLDKKFIPVMAGGALVVIDQHAADERIRLEELRRKVLSGECSTVTYLDPEQELVLPEMGFQLLQKYAQQIQKWGWICNSRSQCSGSFAKNMKLLKRHTCDVTLTAVPCILGINLTAKDLVEYIEQLVETDGSSTLPPSVVHILNFKACRGAIMFGDPLLPSECSLIVEELKATSLCFQCAHGRPTTVPLLNMASLHEQLARLEMQKASSSDAWHGLQRHRPSVNRAQLRLDSAKRFCNG